MPKYQDKYSDRRQSDESLTVVVLIGGTLIGIVALMSFMKESLALGALKRRQPWDT
jgi:hypothetical protein